MSEAEEQRKEFVRQRTANMRIPEETAQALAERNIRPGVVVKKIRTCRQCKFQREEYEALGSLGGDDVRIIGECANCGGLTGRVGSGDGVGHN